MKIRINYAEIEITVDNYEHGEGETINAYSLNYALKGKTFETAGELVKAINDAEPALSDNVGDYVFIDGRIDTDALVNDDNERPEAGELEAWKAGKTNLYNLHLFVGLSLVEEREFTETDAEKHGIEIY